MLSVQEIKSKHIAPRSVGSILNNKDYVVI